MKTKFILHGGFAKGAEQENDAFFSEILKTAPNRAKVLLVYFAKDADRIADSKTEDVEQFNKNKGDRVLSFQVAGESSFPEQVREADIVYLGGGHSDKLLDALKKYSNLREI